MRNYIMIYVIIPVYHAERYIASALDSVLEQPCSNLEIICVDDGSPDDSISVLRHYAERFPNVHVLRQENAGVSAARNTGIEYALAHGSDGDYLAFLDADDCWCRNAMHQEDLDSWAHAQLICFNSVNCTHDLSRIAPTPPAAPVKTAKGGSGSFGCISGRHLGASLYSLKLVRDHNIRFVKGLHYGEDLLFCRICCYLAEQIVLTGQPLYQYRANPNGAMGRKTYGIDYFPAMIRAHADTASALQKYENDIRGSADFFRQQASTITLEMIMEHFILLRGNRELQTFLKNNPDLQEHLDRLDPGSLSAYHSKPLEQYRNAPLLFIAKWQLTGCIRQLTLLLKRIPWVRDRLADRQFPLPNPFL